MNWTWHAASGTDTVGILNLARAHFQSEIDEIFVPDEIAYARNITQAIVAQFYNPRSELIKVAKDNETGTIIAYLWVIRGQRSPWSDQEMIMPRMVHVSMDLPVRARLRLVEQMISIWEDWAGACGVDIVCSTTMRKDTGGFLRLHQHHGYDVRGSFAYKRLQKETHE